MKDLVNGKKKFLKDHQCRHLQVPQYKSLKVQFLYDFINVCKAYFAGEFNEATIRKNFALIYELLDEVMDYGYPQLLDADLLKMYITQGKVMKEETNIEKLKNQLCKVESTLKS